MNSHHSPALPGLFSPTPRQHKRARQTSREVYRRRREVDKRRAVAGRETRAGAVLRLLAWHWNVTQESPTASELWQWATAMGTRIFRHVGDLRPRLTELVAAGLVEPRSRRVCRVTGANVWTWAVREAGSREPR